MTIQEQHIDPPSPEGDPPLLAVSTEQVARALSISLANARRMVVAGTIPSFKLGRRRLIRWTDLEAFVDDQFGKAS